MKNDIAILGDIHGEFGLLNKFLNRRHYSLILQTGDFGYWPHMNYNYQYCNFPKPHDAKLYWCDGNHEDHWSLNKRTTNEFWPNVIYMPRGTILKIPTGEFVLFMGGADSIDKHFRSIGHDWFPEEILAQKDIQKLSPNLKIDIVISHTCPEEFNIKGTFNLNGLDKVTDPSRKALSYILQTYRPSRWYFSHWHVHQKDYNSQYNCRWECLNHISSCDKWFTTL